MSRAPNLTTHPTLVALQSASSEQPLSEDELYAAISLLSEKLLDPTLAADATNLLRGVIEEALACSLDSGRMRGVGEANLAVSLSLVLEAAPQLCHSIIRAFRVTPLLAPLDRPDLVALVELEEKQKTHVESDKTVSILNAVQRLVRFDEGFRELCEWIPILNLVRCRSEAVSSAAKSCAAVLGRLTEVDGVTPVVWRPVAVAAPPMTSAFRISRNGEKEREDEVCARFLPRVSRGVGGVLFPRHAEARAEPHLGQAEQYSRESFISTPTAVENVERVTATLRRF